MRQIYLRQADDGKWTEAIVEFQFDISTGKEIGEVVDFNIYDKKPEFPEESIVYRRPVA